MTNNNKEPEISKRDSKSHFGASKHVQLNIHYYI
jgi:hypothetical protein